MNRRSGICNPIGIAYLILIITTFITTSNPISNTVAGLNSPLLPIQSQMSSSTPRLQSSPSPFSNPQNRVPTAPPLEESAHNYHRVASIEDDKDITAARHSDLTKEKPNRQDEIRYRGYQGKGIATPNPNMNDRNSAYPASIIQRKSTTNTTTRATALLPVDLYARDRSENSYKYFYYRYVNPWIRYLVAFPLLYIYAMFSGILTYRHNNFRDYLIGIVSPVTHPVTLPDGTKPFVLQDLMHDLFPAQEGVTLDHWISFADATPIIWIVIAVVMILIRRDPIRLTEFLVIQLVLFTLNAVSHVLTTYPDAHGYQYSCIRPEFQTWGSWVFSTLTTSYCGDMMWSGHTQNTLIPLIMMRRVLFDYLGWNISWGVRDSIAKRLHQPQLRSWYENDVDRNEHFLEYVNEMNGVAAGTKVQPSTATSTGPSSNPTSTSKVVSPIEFTPQATVDQPAYTEADLDRVEQQVQTENESFQYQSSTDARIAKQNVVPQYAYTQDPQIPESTVDTMPRSNDVMAEQLALQEENALRPHENYDVHINVHAATATPPNVPPNTDNDFFFFKHSSPYTSPLFVQRHRKFFFVLQLILRIIFCSWFIVLVITLMLIRYHYSADVYIAMLVCSLVATNTHLIQTLVRWIYRPYYHNYLYNSWWRPVYLRWPLNDEQINYEERLRKVAVGGLF